MKYAGEILTQVSPGTATNDDTLISAGMAYTIPTSGVFQLPLYVKYRVGFELTNNAGGFKFELDLSTADFALLMFKVINCTTNAIILSDYDSSLLIQQVPANNGKFLLEIDGYIEPGTLTNLDLLFAQDNNAPDQIAINGGSFLHIING